jgi:hypothetical protein
MSNLFLAAHRALDHACPEPALQNPAGFDVDL